MSATITLRASRRLAAFTLLELLAVIGVIALLTGLVLGVGRRAAESGKTARARAELAALAVALDAFKLAHGDYPRTDDPARLLQSLIGRRGPEDQPVNSRALIEVARFATTGGLDPFANHSAALLDPWDRPYRYAYKSEVSWRNPAYVFYSVGPDGLESATLLPGGFAERGAAGNADNLYAD